MSIVLTGLGLTAVSIGLFFDGKSLLLNVKKSRDGTGASGVPLVGLLFYVAGLFLLPGEYVLGIHKGIIFLALFAFHLTAQYWIVLLFNYRNR